MKKAAYNILPRTEDILKTMGEQIKLARLRRSLSAEGVAEHLRYTKSEAESYAEEILATVKQNWERIAADYGLTRRQIEEMRPAFSACYE
jgi:hypothetical protein